MQKSRPRTEDRIHGLFILNNHTCIRPLYLYYSHDNDMCIRLLILRYEKVKMTNDDQFHNSYNW